MQLPNCTIVPSTDRLSDSGADVGDASSFPPTPQAADENSRSSLKDDFDVSIDQDEKGETRALNLYF